VGGKTLSWRKIRQAMDIATIIGLIGTGALVLISILIGGPLGPYIDYPSIAMVIGGGTLTVLTSVPLKQFLTLPKVVMKAFIVKKQDLRPLVTSMVEFAVVARRDGILALENHINDTTHPFAASGIRMAVDGTDPELIEKLLNAEIESLADRHKSGKQVCDLMGKYAPAFGMIGTLVGLVAMLGNMADPSSIGPSMAVALLTTLYGALIANAMFLPISDKLSIYSRQEMTARLLILQGVMAIQQGDNPRIVESKLNVFLSPKERATQG
jgi:chemotaxis protein MotA